MAPHRPAQPADQPASHGAGPVLVVGGGPAGLEAARVLALRGHPVELAERGPQLGGLLAVAALLAGRAGWPRPWTGGTRSWPGWA